MPSRNQQWGFSFVEVLVCVALIGLLAAVAVPRFVRVQNAADVAQAKSDLATLKTALESYKVDLGMYPWQNDSFSALMPRPVYDPGNRPTLERLTTPIAYLGFSGNFYDVFPAEFQYAGISGDDVVTPAGPDQINYFKQYCYNARNFKDMSIWDQTNSWDVDPYWYYLESAGPDLHHHATWQIVNTFSTDTTVNRARISKFFYDPTNGTVSRGSIWEVGGVPQGMGTSMAFMINAANGSSVGDWERY